MEESKSLVMVFDVHAGEDLGRIPFAFLQIHGNQAMLAQRIDVSEVLRLNFAVGMVASNFVDTLIREVVSGESLVDTVLNFVKPGRGAFAIYRSEQAEIDPESLRNEIDGSFQRAWQKLNVMDQLFLPCSDPWIEKKEALAGCPA